MKVGLLVVRGKVTAGVGYSYPGVVPKVTLGLLGVFVQVFEQPLKQQSPLSGQSLSF